MNKTEVFCTLEVEGTHNWPGCPHEEVAYLRDIHRHLFYIKAYKTVTHSDRETEFILLKHQIKEYILQKYYKVNNNVANFNLCEFGARSCEMIAQELIDHFNLSRCEISEDFENGAIVTVVET